VLIIILATLGVGIWIATKDDDDEGLDIEPISP